MEMVAIGLEGPVGFSYVEMGIKEKTLRKCNRSI